MLAVGPTMLRHPRPVYMMDAHDDSSDSESISNSIISRFASSIASSATDMDMDMRTPSPEPSVYSMTPSLRENSYRQLHGRHVNAHSDVYSLPADEEELNRLHRQHEMFKQTMGPYPPPLPAVLAQQYGLQKRVVDLGCGSGSWILDVARDFPHTECVAVDLVPMQNLEMPLNCRSEVDDINLGLQHYMNTFDVVHARLICTGIKHFAELVDHMAHALRPGGLIDLTEYNFILHDGNKQPIIIPDEEVYEMRGPWLPRWMKLAQYAIQKRGGEVDAADHLYMWVADHGAFQDVVRRQFWYQASPWNRGNDPESVRQNAIAMTMREDMQEFLRSGRPLLLGAGIPEFVVNIVEEAARQELNEAQTPLYILIENVYATRRNN